MRPCERLDLGRVESPAYVIDLAVLERNLELLAHAQAAAGATVLLALKGFAAWSSERPDLRKPGLTGQTSKNGSRRSAKNTACESWAPIAWGLSTRKTASVSHFQLSTPTSWSKGLWAFSDRAEPLPWITPAIYPNPGCG